MLLKSNNSQNSSNAFEKLRALEDILRSRGLSYTFLEPPSEVGTSVNIKPLDLYHYSLAIGTLALRLGQENYPTLLSMLTIYLEDTEKAEKILNQWLLESKTLCPCCQHE